MFLDGINMLESVMILPGSYLLWLEQGKPQSGVWFDDMHKSRIRFKLALRYRRHHGEEMRADVCARSVLDKDARKFWHDIDKINNARATGAMNTVGGVSGDTEILATWKKYYERLYCEKFNQHQKDAFFTCAMH
jgi:hypothetical protein